MFFYINQWLENFRLLLIKALRPDRILSSTKKFTFTLLGDDVLRESEKVLDFKKIIETEVRKLIEKI